MASTEGFAELAKRMRELPDLLARKSLRGAVNAGASVIKKEAQLRAPKLTGALAKNFYQKQIKEASTVLSQTFYVGVRSGLARYAKTKANKKAGRAGKVYKDSGATFYWFFLEFGTSKMPARPFLRPAFESRKNDAVTAIGEKIRTELEKHRQSLVTKT